MDSIHIKYKQSTFLFLHLKKCQYLDEVIEISNMKFLSKSRFEVHHCD